MEQLGNAAQTANDKISDVELLFVRACKSRHARKRIRSVYRRFYMGSGFNEAAVAGILARICDQYLNLRVVDIICDLDPSKGWMYGITDSDSHMGRCIKVMESYLRNAHKDRFPGAPDPAWVRNRERIAA